MNNAKHNTDIFSVTGSGGGGGGKSGGGGGQRTPVNERDSLDSIQYFEVLHLISEGEIDGLVDGLKSVYFDNTPLQNPDGSFNFKDVQVVVRNGTQTQSYIPGATEIENEKVVGVAVTQSTPIVRTVTNSGINAVRVTINFPAIRRINNQGDQFGDECRLQIAVQNNGGGYNTVVDDTIRGRTDDLYQKDYLVNIAGPFPVNIRVSRVTPDSVDANTVNAFSWSSYTEISYARLGYPNSALVWIRAAADQFSSIPSCSFVPRGIKVQIPSNATVDRSTGRLIYDGIWNGSFGAAQWTTDPAWVLWDLCVEKRYGFGDHIEASMLSKWDWYEASKYCNELVPDGLGGMEPRFSCTAYISTSEEAYTIINNLCSVFRSMSYWSAGAVAISQDRPADPSFEFSLANVSPEGFSYSDSSLKTRPNVAVVSFFSNELRDIDYEVVENVESVNKYGVIRSDIEAFACISRGQANRLGKWLIHAQQEIISFKALPDSSVGLRPGKIIKVFDPLKAGSRRAGRIKAATTNSVTVDDTANTDILFEDGSTLSVILPDGTVEDRPIISIIEGVITVSPEFSTAPNTFSMWGIESPSLQSSLWRILTVAEEDGLYFPVTAIKYDPSLYRFIENGEALQTRDVTNLNIIPSPPNNIVASEVLFDSNGIARSKLIISWQSVLGVRQYRVRWRRENDNWTTQTVERVDYEILDSIPGIYQIEVFSIASSLRTSTLPAALTVQAFGKTAAPLSPTGINVLPIDEASAILSWDRSTELDVLLGGKVLIRHSASKSDAKWEESQEIVFAAAGGQTQKQVPLLEGTYLIKFEDDSGNRSWSAATASVELPKPQPRLLVKTFREDQETPPFSGNVTNMFYSTELDGLVLSLGETIDSITTNIDTWPSFDGQSSSKGSGEYEFGSTYDMGGIFDVNLRRYFRTAPYYVGDLWDSRRDNIDAWPSIDGLQPDQVNATLLVRSTNDDLGSSPLWTPWREFANAIVRGRAFQFKVVATSEAESQNIAIYELGCELELQQRTEFSATLTSGALAYAVTFAQPFYQAPAVGVTAYNMNAGDYYKITNQSRSGFTVSFFDSANTAVSRQFSYTAVGFGREVI